jgi:phospholipid transport system substrate-binding protein
MRPHMLNAGNFVIALFVLGGLLAPFDAHAANAAESFVQSNIDKSYALLNDPKLDATERRQAFASQLRSMVDTRRVAQFTLGPFGRDASKEDLEGFTAAFTDFLTNIYQQALNRYKNRSIRVTGSTARSGDDVIVTALVNNGSGPSSELHIAFRVRQSDQGGYAITDFQAEGAWLALTQRADFSSYLQQHGGSLMQLSTELQARAERIRADLARAETRS